MKNSLEDLNNHLFAQLERLGDEELTTEQVEQEIKRTKAVTAVAEQVISNANTLLTAERLRLDYGFAGQVKIPKIITQDSGES